MTKFYKNKGDRYFSPDRSTKVIRRSPQIQQPIQAKPSFRDLSQELAAKSQPVQLREEENKTGLPDDLKAGVEALSGFSMDDVRVHYNSSKPAQLQALAYMQGTEIHVGPG